VVHLTGFPEKVRRALERLVTELRVKENVYGVGLFGSWSRGDAAASSDIDLLILDKGDFAHEYVERFEVNGLFIDLNHIPKKWLSELIPPEIDQKLYEAQILYDRDWSLNNTKLLMVRSYSSPERVDIRTEAHVIDSDIYLSRATSAFSRDDFQSARLLVVVALENVLKVLVEIALEPSSASRFVENLEVSAAKLGRLDLFNDFLGVSSLTKAGSGDADAKLRLFRMAWGEMKTVAEQNVKVLDTLHFKVKTKLDYYLNPAFLHGFVLRTNSLVASGRVIEACHYVNSVFFDLFESYMWLRAAIAKVKIDYTTLIRSLETLEKSNPRICGYVGRLLGLDAVDKAELAGAIEKTREIVLRVRRERKALIKNHLLKS